MSVIEVKGSIEPKDLEKVGCLSKERTIPPQIKKELSKYIEEQQEFTISLRLSSSITSPGTNMHLMKRKEWVKFTI